MAELPKLRIDYNVAGLSRADLVSDPISQFDRWLDDAISAEIAEPNALVLATVDDEGKPWSRYVLLKAFTVDGFDFCTNFESDKSKQLAINPVACMTFGWLKLHRQVRVAGTVEKAPAEVSDHYWAERPRESQISSMVSNQSQPVGNRKTLQDRYKTVEAEQLAVSEIVRPPHWGCWRLFPHTIEFWQGQKNRLHDRFRYSLDVQSGQWSCERLQP